MTVLCDILRITDILEGYRQVVTPFVYEKLVIDVKTAFDERDAFWATQCHDLRKRHDDTVKGLEEQLTINEQQHQQLCELRAINRRYGLMIDRLLGDT